jgi:hypothetical protein
MYEGSKGDLNARARLTFYLSSRPINRTQQLKEEKRHTTEVK